MLPARTSTSDAESFSYVIHDVFVFLCESIIPNFLLQVAKDFVGPLQLSFHVVLGFLARLLFQPAQFSVFSRYLLLEILCLSLHSA